MGRIAAICDLLNGCDFLVAKVYIWFVMFYACVFDMLPVIYNYINSLFAHCLAKITKSSRETLSISLSL